MKNISKILKITFVITLFISCKNSCEKEHIEIYYKAREGDVDAVKEYIANGEDINESCYNYKAGRLGGYTDFVEAAIFSKSEEMMKLILKNKDVIGDYQLTKMLIFSYNDNNRSFSKFIINKYNIAICYSDYCEFIRFYGLDFLRYLNSISFDLKKIDGDGNNILMLCCKCSSENDEDEKVLVNLLKYLVKTGVKSDVKNKEGKTAYDIAVNEKVKEYLKSLE